MFTKPFKLATVPGYNTCLVCERVILVLSKIQVWFSIKVFTKEYKDDNDPGQIFDGYEMYLIWVSTKLLYVVMNPLHGKTLI